ncbi:cytochrome P450 2B4 isoform X2 [Heterocephalus glaber]|nr:cytochrome P450 2B4 isoform X2 [Heterocephalus glaber]
MRDFGMGKWSMEERIQEEAQCLVEELRKSQGGLVDPLFLFQSATANIICSIVFGKRFDYKDRQFLRLLDLIYQSFALISSFSSQMFELFPSILKHFPGMHREISKVSQEIITFIGHSVEKHQETLDPSAPRDFIDAYLLRMEKDKSDPHTEFHHKNLVLTSLSLFFAGTETTSTTLRYGFLFLLKYPHVAERVHKEIEQVIGSHRQRALDDRTKMPYTEAVICEIQRFADLVPIGLPHVVTKDIHFRGFIIPKMSLAGLPHLCNTEIFPILTTALHDPRHFEKPDTFNPDHFLDAKEALKKSEAFMPFSIERVHKEIEQVIGPHHQPALDDRTKMLYTEAVICEIQKFSDLLPIGVPHMVTKDIHLRGFIIPKGSVFALEKALPVLNCSSSSPPSFRISPFPAQWLLRTLTSHPRKLVWAEYPQRTRFTFCPTRWNNGRGIKDYRVIKCPNSVENDPSLPASEKPFVNQHPSPYLVATPCKSYFCHLPSILFVVLPNSILCSFPM